MVFSQVNELNFANDENQGNIFFGYRSIADGSPIPHTYVFGQDGGTAIVKAREVWGAVAN